MDEIAAVEAPLDETAQVPRPAKRALVSNRLEHRQGAFGDLDEPTCRSFRVGAQSHGLVLELRSERQASISDRVRLVYRHHEDLGGARELAGKPIRDAELGQQLETEGLAGRQ